MSNPKWYISTIDVNAQKLAEVYGLGIEIAEYCTAWNMDEYFEETDASVKKKIKKVNSIILHAPFNELFPCAIDLKIREVARERYRKAFEIAKRYGAKKIIIHGGYNPRLYYPVWYTDQSIKFWKEFVNEIPEELTVCLENVFEEEIDMFLDIIKGVNDPRLKICMDIGHVNAYSSIPVTQWILECSRYISHFHIHNNDGVTDYHNNIDDGTMDIAVILKLIEKVCPEATLTLEVIDAVSSVKLLVDKNVILLNEVEG